jgi:hypothetical protein
MCISPKACVKSCSRAQLLRHRVTWEAGVLMLRVCVPLLRLLLLLLLPTGAAGRGSPDQPQALHDCPQPAQAQV